MKLFILLLFCLFAVSCSSPSSEGAVEVVAGTGNNGWADGDGTAAVFNLPNALSGDGTSLYIADTYNNLIRKTELGGKTATVTGSITEYDDYRFPKGFYRDGDVSEAVFNRPHGIAVDARGRVFIADSANHAIRVIHNGAAATFAGHFTDTKFNYPTGIAVDGAGGVYITDTLNHCVRKIDADGTITTIAGVPGTSGYKDGEAISAASGQAEDTGAEESIALFNSPMGIAVTEDGADIYVSDTGNHVIRRISGGEVTTVAGTTTDTDEDGDPLGRFADGKAESSGFKLPVGIIIYGDALIVADSGNHRIRLIDGGEVTTLAGTGEPGEPFNLPAGVYASQDILYIADTGNNQIKRMSLKGVAGNE